MTDGAARGRLRAAAAADVELLWRWANDPHVRASSFHPEPIAFETHERWYAARLRSASARIWILEDHGRPVGQVRYERNDSGEAEVGISVAAEHRGRGYAARLLVESVTLACGALGARVLVAHVLPENDASVRAFLNAGYGQVTEVKRDGRRALRFERKC